MRNSFEASLVVFENGASGASKEAANGTGATLRGTLPGPCQRLGARSVGDGRVPAPAVKVALLCSRNTAEPALPGRRCCPREGEGAATRSARSLGASLLPGF